MSEQFYFEYLEYVQFQFQKQLYFKQFSLA